MFVNIATKSTFKCYSEPFNSPRVLKSHFPTTQRIEDRRTCREFASGGGRKESRRGLDYPYQRGKGWQWPCLRSLIFSPPKTHYTRYCCIITLMASSFMSLQPFVGLGRLFTSLIYTQSAGILGRVISPSQGLYLHTGQHKHRINAYIHALIGIRTHDPSVPASEDSSCVTPRGHCDRQHFWHVLQYSGVTWAQLDIRHFVRACILWVHSVKISVRTDCGLFLFKVKSK
jgi:hypothetical protein